MIERSLGNAEYFYEPSFVRVSSPDPDPLPKTARFVLSAARAEYGEGQGWASCLPSQLTKRRSARDTKEPAALKGLRRGDNSPRSVKAGCPALLKM